VAFELQQATLFCPSQEGLVAALVAQEEGQYMDALSATTR